MYSLLLAYAVAAAATSGIVARAQDPPPPPPPTPTSGNKGFLIQNDCDNSFCTVNCRNHTFPLGACLPLQSGGSVIVSCIDEEEEDVVKSHHQRRGEGEQRSMVRIGGGSGSGGDDYVMTTSSSRQLVSMLQFPFSANCVGKNSEATMRTDVCLLNKQGGGYFQNYCMNDMTEEEAARYGKPGRFVIVDE